FTNCHEPLIQVHVGCFDFRLGFWDFLNGLGGNALLGTFSTVLSASRNRVNASGPSCISALGFIYSIMPVFVVRVPGRP
ncbi:MAG: hypothetical protein ABSE57_21250, partial [Bryobacteraceae bacterium]